jgi:hypothetical protein
MTPYKEEADEFVETLVKRGVIPDDETWRKITREEAEDALRVHVRRILDHIFDAGDKEKPNCN